MSSCHRRGVSGGSWWKDMLSRPHLSMNPTADLKVVIHFLSTAQLYDMCPMLKFLPTAPGISRDQEEYSTLSFSFQTYQKYIIYSSLNTSTGNFGIYYSSCLYSFSLCKTAFKFLKWVIDAYLLAIWSLSPLDNFSYQYTWSTHFFFTGRIVSILLENISKFIISHILTEHYIYSFLSLFCFNKYNAIHRRIFVD